MKKLLKLFYFLEEFEQKPGPKQTYLSVIGLSAIAKTQLQASIDRAALLLQKEELFFGRQLLRKPQNSLQEGIDRVQKDLDHWLLENRPEIPESWRTSPWKIQAHLSADARFSGSKHKEFDVFVVPKNAEHDLAHAALKELKKSSQAYKRPPTRQKKPKALLHICCGPDAAGVIKQMKQDFELLCFWYDPNIQPKSEHDKRLEAFKSVATKEKTPWIEGEYDVAHFLSSIKGLERTPEQGAKCSVCYDLRLERSALEAKKQDCDLFTTTLAISPHKVQQKLKSFGEVSGKKHGVPYFHHNFMKREGFKDSVHYSREYQIYRQDYCGCWFSLHEGGKQAQKMARDHKNEIEALLQ